jgi:hypothetical protein
LQGFEGLPGLTGPKGNMGIGYEGAKGDPGLPGLPGVPGSHPRPGPVSGPSATIFGPKGSRGDPGIPGEKGESGPVGFEGSSGVPVSCFLAGRRLNCADLSTSWLFSSFFSISGCSKGTLGYPGPKERKG